MRTDREGCGCKIDIEHGSLVHRHKDDLSCGPIPGALNSDPYPEQGFILSISHGVFGRLSWRLLEARVS